MVGIFVASYPLFFPRIASQLFLHLANLILKICGTLLTDLNPYLSSTAQASYNLVRCALAGAGLAALQALIEAVGVGWCFTVYAGMCLIAVPLLWMLQTFGMSWRRKGK